MRLGIAGMTDFEVYITQAFTMLKPGVYPEIQELEFPWMSHKCPFNARCQGPCAR